MMPILFESVGLVVSVRRVCGQSSEVRYVRACACLYLRGCMRECQCVCVRACVRARARARVRACVCAFVRA